MDLKNRLDTLRRQAGAEPAAAELAGGASTRGPSIPGNPTRTPPAAAPETAAAGGAAGHRNPGPHRPDPPLDAALTAAGTLRGRLERLAGRAAPRSQASSALVEGAAVGLPPSTPSPAPRRRSPAGSAGELAERLGGTVVTEHLVLVESLLPLHAPHGRWRLTEALEPLWPLTPFPTHPPRVDEGLDSSFPPDGLIRREQISNSRRLAQKADGRMPGAEGPGVRAGGGVWGGTTIVGIDTETTGLAGGTGTAAFMVGIAEAGPAHVRLRQWLLTAFSGEAAMLTELAASLAGAGLMVSYNGKTFDLPLLRDRRRLLRQPALPEPPHLDLLHPTRRLFRGAWPDCRLATAEQRLLGLFREDDLPGSEAPRAWRDYLAGEPPDDLERVLRHNALDVLSLLLLGPALVRALHDPASFGAEALAAADTWSRRGEPARALSVLEASRGHLDTRGELELAWALRKAGRWAEAAAIWERLARGGCAEAVERLAKYHEHVRGDWSSALDYANRLEEGPEAGRRRQRLQRRLATTQGRLDL